MFYYIQEINHWTAEKSHRRIMDVLPTAIIGRDMWLLLLAASYIKVIIIFILYSAISKRFSLIRISINKYVNIYIYIYI